MPAMAEEVVLEARWAAHPHPAEWLLLAACTQPPSPPPLPSDLEAVLAVLQAEAAALHTRVASTLHGRLVPEPGTLSVPATPRHQLDFAVCEVRPCGRDGGVTIASAATRLCFRLPRLPVHRFCPAAVSASLGALESVLAASLGRPRGRRTTAPLRPVVLTGGPGSGKSTLCRLAADRLKVPALFLSAWDVCQQLADTPPSSDGLNQSVLLDKTLCRALLLAPSLLVVRDVGAFLAAREWLLVRARLNALRGCPDHQVCIVLLSGGRAAQLRQLQGSEQAAHVIPVEPPDAAQRLSLLEHFCSRVGVAAVCREDLAPLANRTAGFAVRDLEHLVRAAHIAPMLEAEAIGAVTTATAQPGRFVAALWEHVAQVQPSVLQHFTTSTDRIPWTHVGGYDVLKRRLQALLQTLTSGTVQRLGTKPPSGLLLHGPPGCGKSFMVRALASNSSPPFICVQASSLFSKYLGDTEKEIRMLFAAARRARPCVVFVDEVDAVAAARGRHASSTGVRERALSQLLNEMDGIQDTAGVFVIGCTNQPLAMLDAAVLRPGRLEITEQMALPSTADREAILALLAARHHCTASSDELHRVALDTEGFSAARLQQLFRKACRAVLRAEGTQLTADGLRHAMSAR